MLIRHTGIPRRVNRQQMGRPLSLRELADQNRRFQGRSGVSQENRSFGFLPAFLDLHTGAIYLSCFADGRLAPIHLLDGLPSELIAERTPEGTATTVRGSVIAGFVRDGRLYTSEEAALTVSNWGASRLLQGM